MNSSESTTVVDNFGIFNFSFNTTSVYTNFTTNSPYRMEFNHTTDRSNITMLMMPDPVSKGTLVFLSLLFCIICTIGLLGNSLVIIVVLFDRKMRQSVTNIFIMNLATADFIIMFVGVPEIVQFMMDQGWHLGPVLCKINRFVLVVCLYVSILSLVFVCVERFVAIVYPLKAHIFCGRKKIVFAILLIWPTSIACGLPTVIYNQVVRPHSSAPELCMIVFPQPEYRRLFEYLQFVFFYLIPVVVQVVLYAVIGQKLYASTEDLNARFQMRSGSRLKPNKTSDTIKARKDVVKMLASSVLVYILCYAPPQILLLYETFSHKAFPVTFPFRVFCIVISNVNSAANPILYSIFSQNFRKNFKKYLCCLCFREPRQYHRTVQEISDSRMISRKISTSMSRSTTFSKV
ncbi:Olfactory receptor [Mactra antiquata]